MAAPSWWLLPRRLNSAEGGAPRARPRPRAAPQCVVVMPTSLTADWQWVLLSGACKCPTFHLPLLSTLLITPRVTRAKAAFDKALKVAKKAHAEERNAIAERKSVLARKARAERRAQD